MTKIIYKEIDHCYDCCYLCCDDYSSDIYCNHQMYNNGNTTKMRSLQKGRDRDGIDFNCPLKDKSCTCRTLDFNGRTHVESIGCPVHSSKE